MADESSGAELQTPMQTTPMQTTLGDDDSAHTERERRIAARLEEVGRITQKKHVIALYDEVVYGQGPPLGV